MNDQLTLVREAFYRRERLSVPLARDFTRKALADWGVHTRADDVLLCVSELTTNALHHGVPPGRGFRLFLYLHHPALLRVEVHDSGDGTPAVRTPDDESGRGLRIVDALSDLWGVGERDPGKFVWCQFSLDGWMSTCPNQAKLPAVEDSSRAS
ncbi:ATP-binding protein [Streptomyces sp. NPDC048717]|uniref:ATP-binding protein n=1 Tax=Streptomyces sp. NPDC048717 TaxID=3154928 RepID=UPI00342983ED